jgi:hypothetical protein
LEQCSGQWTDCGICLFSGQSGLFDGHDWLMVFVCLMAIVGVMAIVGLRAIVGLTAIVGVA